MNGPQPVPLVPGVVDGLGQPVNRGPEGGPLSAKLDDIVVRLALIEAGLTAVEGKLDQLERRIDSAIEASA